MDIEIINKKVLKIGYWDLLEIQVFRYIIIVYLGFN